MGELDITRDDTVQAGAAAHSALHARQPEHSGYVHALDQLTDQPTRPTDDTGRQTDG